MEDIIAKIEEEIADCKNKQAKFSKERKPLHAEQCLGRSLGLNKALEIIKESTNG
jgi:hypothetical protein